MQKMIMNPFHSGLYLFFLFVVISCKRDPDEMLRIAGWHAKKGRYKEAIIVLDQAIKEHPKYLKAYSYKSAYLSMLPGRRKEAIEFITKAIEIDSTCYECFSWRGQLTKGREGLEDLNKALELNDKDIMSYCERARIKEELEDYNGAIKDFTKALSYSKVVQKSSEILSDRGKVWLKKFDFVNSKSDFDEAIKLDSASAMNYYARFIYHFSSRSPKSLILKDFQQSLKLGLDTSLVRIGKNMIEKIPEEWN